jgi:hypothetical protein
MAGNEQSRGNALTILAAGGVAGLVASLMSHKPVAGASGVELPPEVLTALAALVANADATSQQLTAILNAMGSGIGPQNPTDAVIFTIRPPLVGVAVQFPEYLIAYDKALIIRAYPLNAGNMLVGNTKAEAENINSSWLLTPNDVVGWKIANSQSKWVSCTVAGDGVMCTAERRP